MNKLKVIENFLKYLTSHGVSKSSIKFYKSDIKNFLIWTEDNEINKNLVKQYISLQKLTVPPSTINRRLSTLRSFANFIQSDFMEGVENVGFPEKQVSSNKYQISSIAPYKGLQEWLLNKVAHPKISNSLFKLFFNRPKWYKKYHTYPISSYVHTAILILFVSIAGYGIYDQIFRNYTNPQAFPSAPTRPNRFLSFQGRLTDDLGNPITTATNHVFKLYDADTGGTELWSSGTCSVTPDQDGIFSVILGSSCGSEITSSVFSENAEVWLGVTVASDSEATPRIQIATVAYALNSETLQGFPAGTGVSTIPYIDSTGKLAIAASSPTIESTSGTFGVVGQALTISTADTTDGNITLNPDGTGTLNLTFEGTSAGGGANGFVNATNANITSGSLYSGTVASNATGYNFINFLSGSSPTSKFSVDSTGLTRIGADLYLTSGLSTFGTAVSDGTIEATRFCTGDGETNCVTDFSSLGGGGNWTVSGNNLYPTTLLNLVGVGTSSPLSRLSVVNNPGAGNYTGKAAFLVNQYENQDILTASASGTTKLSLTNDGTLKLHDASSTITNDSGDIVLNSAADFDFSNDNLKNINTLNAVNAILSGILQVGHTSATTYSRFGSSATSHSGSINSASDILVSGDLELDGVLYLDGGNISNSAGTAFISFSGNNLYLNSSGDVTILEDPTIQLSASNPTISATTTNSTLGLTTNGTGTLTLQGSATGNIQFFNSNNTLTSSGNLTIAGDIRINGNDIADSGGTNRISLGATTTLTNTTTTLSGTTTLTASSLATMTTASTLGISATAVNLGGSATLRGGTAASGTLTLDSTSNATKGNIQFFSSSNTLSPTGDLTIAGDIRINGNDIADSGGTNRIGLGATTTLTNTTTTLSGTTTLTASSLATMTTASTLGISATAVNLGGSATLRGGTAASGTLTLDSTSNATKGNIQFFSSSNTLSSTGNLVLAGDLRLNGNDILDSAGTTRIALGATTTLTNTTTTLSGTTTLTASSLATMTTASSVNWGGLTALTFTADNATIYGSDIADGNLTLHGTSSGTKDTSIIALQPSGGRVGIGLSNPIGGGGSLEVAGAKSSITDGAGVMTVTDTTAMATDVGAGIAFRGIYTSGGASAGFGGIKAGKSNSTSGNLDSYLAFYSRANSGGITEAMRIIAGGNIGMGNTAPGAHRLSVTGTAGLSTGTAWTNTSDFRLKNIENELAGSALDKIMKLRPVSFRWNELHNQKFGSTGDKLNLGFIAQEVENILPYMISTDENGYKWYNPSGFEALLTASIQEQQSQIKSIESNFKKIESELATLNNLGNLEITVDNQVKVKNTNTFINKVAAYTKSMIGELQTGIIKNKKLETNIISPIADSELIIDLSASESARLVVKGQNGDEVASIDNLGKLTVNSLQTTEDATISGTLYADNIESQRLDEIENLLRNVETNQLLVDESSNWNTDTFNQSLAIEELFVTGTAVLTNISLAENIYLGLDMVIQGTNNSISSLTSPLLIQPLALASIEIMAGKVKIDTQGNVSFEGNVEIAGDLTINTLLIANTQETATPSASLNDGEINTNATAGKAKLPATLNSIKINNQNIKESSLIYVTPITNTQNKVLFVKSKGEGYFEIGFDEAIDTDTEFNWWIIELR